MQRIIKSNELKKEELRKIELISKIIEAQKKGRELEQKLKEAEEKKEKGYHEQ